MVGVVAAEMPAAFLEEALKAQAVAARTYQVRQMQAAGVESVLYDVGQAYIRIEEQKEYEEASKECYDAFMKYCKVNGVQRFLPKGYPIKVFVYKHFPKLYIKLYGRLRKA